MFGTSTEIINGSENEIVDFSHGNIYFCNITVRNIYKQELS